MKLNAFIENTKILKSFEEKHKGTKDKIKELEFKKANISSEATKLEEKRKEAKGKIPKLEAEQKTMVATKNFKGAGMKKAEIKEAQESIEALGKQIEKNFIEEKKIEEEVAGI